LGEPKHVLHVFPSFGIGGVPLRMARVVNHFGARLRHSIIALDQDFAAAEGLAEGIDVSLLASGEARRGTPRSVIDNAMALRRLRPDLLVTYNWGAIEWAMADRLLPVAPQIHIEAGFSKEEADRQIHRRVLFRRWALARCAKIVVPSRQLENLARTVWRLPPDRIALVPNGVDIERFADPLRDAIPGFARKDGEVVVGTVAPLRPEKNVGRLLRVFAALDGSPAARLVIAGDGAERPMLAQLAAELGIAERVVFIGRVAPEAVLGTFDVFALSSDTEQMPNALLEAMAASRAVAAVDVGDIKHIVSEDNREFVVPRDDGAAFTAVLQRLLRDPARRAALGRQNRRRTIDFFSQDRMFTAYSSIFGLDVPSSVVDEAPPDCRQPRGANNRAGPKPGAAPGL
jgi:L-malate glycosyltransferase